jgi:hypothetical protein
MDVQAERNILAVFAPKFVMPGRPPLDPPHKGER